MAGTPISIEIRPADAHQSHDGSQGRIPSTSGARFRVVLFLLVFLISAVTSLSYVLMRPEVYRSVGSLLIVPPAKVVLSTQQFSTPDSLDQQAMVQRQLLLAQPILDQVVRELEQTADGGATVQDITGLRQDLSVTRLPDTRILELAAEGGDPDAVSRIVDTWIDAYLESTDVKEEDSAEANRREIEKQLADLEARTFAKRAELEAFREKHDIVSMQREENQVLARLKGLFESLNNAADQKLAAETALEALRDAKARGEPIVPPNEQRQIHSLEERTVDAEEALADLGQVYTENYLSLDPKIVAERRRIQLLRQKIEEKQLEAEAAAFSEHERAVQSWTQSVADLQAQLDQHRELVSVFSSRFAEHEALEEELSQLELLYRETQERLVKTQVTGANVVAQAEVLERSFPNYQPIRPNYWRDSGIALAGSFGLGLLAVWLHGFLLAAPKGGGHYDARIAAPMVTQPEAEKLVDTRNVHLLERGLPRELSTDEFRALLLASDPQQRALIQLMLSGLTVEEAAAVRWEDCDDRRHELWVRGASARAVPMAGALAATLRLLETDGGEPAGLILATENEALPNIQLLRSSITSLALSSGLSAADTIDASAVRHSYISHLVRQGTRIRDVPRVAGHLSASEIDAYRFIAPPGKGRALEEVDAFHPAMKLA